MGFQVKVSKPHLRPPPSHRCRHCSFKTRHRILLSNHEVVCPNKGMSDTKVVCNNKVNFNRNYCCTYCNFATTKSRQYLHHQIEVHGLSFQIYNCDLCDYASKYKQKMLRHRTLRHKGAKAYERSSKEEDADQLGEASVPRLTGQSDPAPLSESNMEELGATAARDEVVAPLPEKKSRRKPAVVRRVSQTVRRDVTIMAETGEVDDESDGEVTMEAGGFVGQSSKIPELFQPIQDRTSSGIGAAVSENDLGNNTDTNGSMSEEVYDSDAPPSGVYYDEDTPMCIPEMYMEDKSALSEMIEDLSNAENGAKFACIKCGHSTETHSEMCKHVNQLHFSQKTYTCDKCNFVTNRRLDFCLHKTKHSDKIVYSCKECQYYTTLKANLDRHMLNHGGDGSYKCQYCNYTSSSAGGIRAHETHYHSEDSTNASNISTKPNFVYTSSGMQQVKFHSRDGSPAFNDDLRPEVVYHEVASMPGASGRGSTSLGSNTVCSECGYKARSPAKLQDHMLSHSKIALYSCDVCGLRYRRSSDLNRHMKQKHNVRLKDYVDKRKLDDTDVESPLDLCVKRMAYSLDDDAPSPQSLPVSPNPSQPQSMAGSPESPLDLSVQMKLANNPDIPPYEVLQPDDQGNGEDLRCNFCSYIAKWPSDLRRHLKVHSLEKRYRCRVCGKKYKYLGDVNAHMRKIHGIYTSEMRVTRPKTPSGTFVCHYCNYVAVYQSQLERHVRLHTGDKPYKCLYCEYASSWRGDLKRHIDKHHAEKLAGTDIDTIMLEITKEVNSKATNEVKDTEEESEASYMTENQSRSEEWGLRPLDGIETNVEAYPLTGPFHEDRPTDVTTSPEYKEQQPSPAVSVSTVPSNTSELHCTYCSYTARAPSKLKAHIAIHENLKMFKCPECGQRANWKWDIQKHMRKEHPGSEIRVLQLTTEEAKETLPQYMASIGRAIPKPHPQFSNQPIAAEKENTPEPELPLPFINLGASSQPYKCSNCDRKSTWRWDIAKHIRTMHPGQQASVLYEEPSSTTKKTIQPEEPVDKKPPIADFSTGGSLINKLTYAPESVGMSEQSSLTEDSQNDDSNDSLNVTKFNPNLTIPLDMSRNSPSLSMMSDMSSETPNFERYKGEGFSASSIDSKKYMPHGSGGRRGSGYPQGDDRPYRCTKCHRRSNWKWDLKKHIERCHPDDRSAEIADERPCKVPFRCTKCSMRAATEAEIAEHIEKEHQNDPEAEISFEKANAFTVLSPEKQYQFHISTPENTSYNTLSTSAEAKNDKDTRPYKCSHCDRRSNWNSDINRHIRIKHPNTTAVVLRMWETESPAKIVESTTAGRPGTVPYYPAPATKEDDRRPFMCSKCGKRSNWKWDVNKHIRGMHPNSDARCIAVYDQTTPVYVKGAAARESKEREREMRELYSSPSMVPSGRIIDTLAANTSTSEARPDTPESRHDERSPAELGYDPNAFIDNPHSSRSLYKCSHCQQTSQWSNVIKRHVTSKHGNVTHKHAGQEAKLLRIPPGGGKGVIVEIDDEDDQFMPEGSLIIDEETPKEESMEIKSDPSNPQHALFVRQSSNSRTKSVDNRPFKCSLCDRRSNWKWDLKKHIRLVHEGTDAEVLEMYSPGVSNVSQAMHVESVINPVINSGADEDKPPTHTDTFNLKRFKCSGCHYRSNWRSDIWRHIQRKHPKEARIIILSKQEAANTLVDYLKVAKRKFSLPSSFQKNWKCKMCNFKNTDKQKMLVHIQTSHESVPDASFAEVTAVEHEDVGEESTDEMVLEDDGGDEELRIDDTATDLSMSGGSGRQMDAISGAYHPYQCKLCGITASLETELRKHLREKHGTMDYSQCDVGEFEPHSKRLVDCMPVSVMRPRKYKCTHCPYQTDKPQQFEFHQNCHMRQPGHKYKCKYCPYWLSVPRLMHQHIRLHLQNKDWKPQETETETPGGESVQAATRKPYQCSACPYATRSRHDILYHRQFHREKPSSPYKCTYCPYWVSQRRLLSQHMALHERENGVNEPDLVMSPSQSDQSDESRDYDVIETASIKQELIQSRIKSAILKPAEGFRHEENNNFGYFDSNGDYQLRKLHKCKYCPYTNVRQNNLRAHERMHGFREGRHKCPYCDYHVGNKGLLAHHVKVHSFQYTPGEDIMDFPQEELENVSESEEGGERNDIASPAGFLLKQSRTSGKHVLENVRNTKYACEKCPYASLKADNYERHTQLHGSKQAHLCDYCDYSVPTKAQLDQHTRLHTMPNPNLLAIQSMSNLQCLPDVQAHIAMASSLDGNGKPKLPPTCDDLDMYEHTETKDYECNKCPYSTKEREEFKEHLVCHAQRSTRTCPYCDYSVSQPKQLETHILLHFKKEEPMTNGKTGAMDLSVKSDEGNRDKRIDRVGEPSEVTRCLSRESSTDDESAHTHDLKVVVKTTPTGDEKAAATPDKLWICQYCDCAFNGAELLLKHEMHHLVENKQKEDTERNTDE